MKKELLSDVSVCLDGKIFNAGNISILLNLFKELNDDEQRVFLRFAQKIKTTSCIRIIDTRTPI